MNKYPLSLRQRLSFRWASRRSFHDDLRTLAVLLAILLAYGVAGRIDYETELAIEAEANANRAQQIETVLIDCMAGRARWTYENGSGKGYGKTAVVCKGVEEISI